MSPIIEPDFLQDPRLAAFCLDALLTSLVLLALAGGGRRLPHDI